MNTTTILYTGSTNTTIETNPTQTITVTSGGVNTGPQGLQGITGLPGQDGTDGKDGINGTNGIDGINGTNGGDGTDGSIWLSGNGVPATGFGSITDWYLDEDNGDIYQKTGIATWTLQDNITGPQGIQGEIGNTGTPGALWRNGAGVPSDALGIDGDYYLNDTNGDYYLRVTGAYVLQGNIEGPQGIQGIQGDQGIQGIQGDPGVDGTSVPAGGTALQILEKIDGTDYNFRWATQSGGVAWGGITGTLSSQADLQSALDSKSGTGHNHAGTYEPADATIVKDADFASNGLLKRTAVGVYGIDASAYIVAAGVTYEVLDTNGDVGAGAGQLAIGNHNHSGVYEPADSTLVKDADFAANGFLERTAAGVYTTILNKWDATAAPAVTDDTNAGYKIGSTWADVTNDKIYLCIDSSAGAAIWLDLSSGEAVTYEALAASGDVGTGATQVSQGDHLHTGTYEPADASLVKDADFANNGAMERTGAGAYTTILNKRDATTAPIATDDSGSGYSVGSRWIDVTNDKEYVCLDSTVTSAVWTETTGSGSGSPNVTADSISFGDAFKIQYNSGNNTLDFTYIGV